MDNVLIQMPADVKEFLYALTVVQELQIQMVYGSTKEPAIREIDFSLTFRLDPKYKYLEPCLQVVSNIKPTFDYSGWNEYSRGEFSNLIHFDFELASHVAETNRLHITEAFGALLGTTLNALMFGMYPCKQAIYAPLKLLKRNTEDKIKVLINEWDLTSLYGHKLKEYIENNYPEVEVTYAVLFKDLTADIEPRFTRINKFDLVIGLHSDDTYIAANLEKGLIEIFKDEEDYDLYNNYGLKFYAVALGNPDAEYVWCLWENLWGSLRESIYAMKSQNQ